MTQEITYYTTRHGPTRFGFFVRVHIHWISADTQARKAVSYYATAYMYGCIYGCLPAPTRFDASYILIFGISVSAFAVIGYGILERYIYVFLPILTASLRH